MSEQASDKISFEQIEKNINEVREFVDNVIERKNSLPVMQIQLKEISKTIDKLEKMNVETPDSLRAEKTSLISNIAREEDNLVSIKLIYLKLNEIIDIIDKNTLNGVRYNNRTGGRKKCLTASKDLRKKLIETLNHFNGRATRKAIITYMEETYQDDFIPGDLEIRSNNIPVWVNNLQWQRHFMIKEGILKNNSPKGYWELKK